MYRHVQKHVCRHVGMCADAAELMGLKASKQQARPVATHHLELAAVRILDPD